MEKMPTITHFHRSLILNISHTDRAYMFILLHLFLEGKVIKRLKISLIFIEFFLQNMKRNCRHILNTCFFFGFNLCPLSTRRVRFSPGVLITSRMLIISRSSIWPTCLANRTENKDATEKGSNRDENNSPHRKWLILKTNFNLSLLTIRNKSNHNILSPFFINLNRIFRVNFIQRILSFLPLLRFNIQKPWNFIISLIFYGVEHISLTFFQGYDCIYVLDVFYYDMFIGVELDVQVCRLLISRTFKIFIRMITVRSNFIIITTTRASPFSSSFTVPLNQFLTNTNRELQILFHIMWVQVVDKNEQGILSSVCFLNADVLSEIELSSFQVQPHRRLSLIVIIRISNCGSCTVIKCSLHHSIGSPTAIDLFNLNADVVIQDI